MKMKFMRCVVVFITVWFFSVTALEGEEREVVLQNGNFVIPEPGLGVLTRYRYYGCEDTTLLERKPDLNTGMTKNMQLGGMRNDKILIVFKNIMRAIGPGKKIVDARLVLHGVKGRYIYDRRAANDIRVAPLLKPWLEGGGPKEETALPGTTYRRRIRSWTQDLKWTQDGASDRGKDQAVEASAITNTYKNLDTKTGTITIEGLADDVQKFYDEYYKNFGWIIEYDDYKKARGFHTFFSSQSEDITLRPALVIKYIDEPEPRPRDMDLTVTYIERLPEYYRYAPNDPKNLARELYEYKVYKGCNTGILKKPGFIKEKKWPQNGEEVTFIAHVKNVGLKKNSGPFIYRWLINGEVWKSGTFEKGIDPGDEKTFSVKWRWQADHRDHRDQTVGFEVEPTTEVVEHSLNNNRLTDYIEALCFGIHVEVPFYEKMNETQNAMGTYCFEDWIQWQFRMWNEVFMDKSRFAGLAEAGCRERVRIQRINIVPKDKLQGGNHIPDGKSNFKYDGEWGFDFIEGAEKYIEIWSRFVERGLLHECSHQIGAIDIYVMNMDASDPSGRGGKIGVKTPDGKSIITRGYIDPYGGLMGGGYTRYNPQFEPTDLYSSHTVGGFNSNVGYRRGFFGEYTYDLPERIRLQIVDPSNKPISSAKVKIWQSAHKPGRPPLDDDDVWGEVTTDKEGYIVLENRPTLEDKPFTTVTGHTLRPNPFGRINVVGANGVFLLRIEAYGQIDYRFVKLHWFNVAYWKGHKKEYTQVVKANISPTTELGTKNVALGCAARDNLEGERSEHLKHLTDGNYATEWNTAGQSFEGMFIEIDLKHVRNIGEIRLVHYRGGPGVFFKAFKVEVSRSGKFEGKQKVFAWADNYHWYGWFNKDTDPDVFTEEKKPDDEVIKHYQLYRVSFKNEPTRARYVRFTTTEPSGGILNEIEVFVAE